MMSEEVKARLREAGVKKRANRRLLKDVTVADLLVAVDALKEKGKIPDLPPGSLDMHPSFNGAWAAYLSRGSDGQVGTLMTVLAHAKRNFGGYLGDRVLFRLETLYDILRWLGVHEYGRYVKKIDRRIWLPIPERDW